MSEEWEKIERSLNSVSKPGRYIGDEFNTQIKDWGQAGLKVALAFPDLYEIGLSHLGLRILYDMINAQPYMLAERVYTPWPDFQNLLREKKTTLYTLESKTALKDFDVLGFSLQYELSYTNVLSILSLGGVSLLSKDRSLSEPLVIGGGPCVFNPEPIADFFDLFFIGEAEEGLIALLEKISESKKLGISKEKILLELENYPGVYVPSHFEVSYLPDGRLEKIISKTGKNPARAVVRNLEEAHFPEKWLVPYLDIVHDRVTYEIQRGCSRGCRFCQAGMIYRPVRERTSSKIMGDLKKLLADSGYEELSLTSLSSADYSNIEELITEACGCFTPQRINVSLPSLRIDSFSVDLAAKFQANRKGSLTFAPEAGSERLRRVINKGVTGEDLFTAASAAFKTGWQKLKLYFMIGLPTETEDDLAEIVELVFAVLKLGRQIYPRNNNLRITVSISTFVPKAWTPFQWRGQISVKETMEKQHYLQEHLRSRYLELNWHSPEMSYLEGIMARGDRRLSEIIKLAWEKGAQFDGWSDQFKPEIWLQSFQESGIDPNFYLRNRYYDEILPWSHINTGLTMEFLKSEDIKANMMELTSDCKDFACTDCGVCAGLKVSKRIAGVKHD